MPWDLNILHESAARNGLAGIAAISQDGVVTSGDDLEVRGAGSIVMASFVTAAIANWDEGRFHRTLDPNWQHTRTAVRDQTGAVDKHNILHTNYPVKSGDIIRAEADNGNNAQIETCLLAIAYGADPQLSVGMPKFAIPPNAKWINGVGGTTHTANTLTTCAITWSENFNKDQVYRILGMRAYSATAYAARLRFRGKSKAVGWFPGVPAGDTAILNQPFYGDFGSFVGDQTPNAEFLSSGGDTAQYVELLIV